MAKKHQFEDIPAKLESMPELQDELVMFLNMWPDIDAYTPPKNVAITVRQIVGLALEKSRQK